MVEWLLDHYLQAVMRLRVTEQPRRLDEDVDPVAQRAAEALEKMWDIARAQGITDERRLGRNSSAQGSQAQSTARSLTVLAG